MKYTEEFEKLGIKVKTNQSQKNNLPKLVYLKKRSMFVC